MEGLELGIPSEISLNLAQRFPGDFPKLMKAGKESVSNNDERKSIRIEELDKKIESINSPTRLKKFSVSKRSFSKHAKLPKKATTSKEKVISF